MFYTHLMFAFIIGLLLKPFTINYYFVFFLILFGSVFPDIDQKNSFIGKIFRPLNEFVTSLSKHRGIFHSVWFVIILNLLFYFLIKEYLIYSLYFSIGYISHLISDALTYAGINFLHPIKKFNISGFIATGSFSEFLFDILLVVIIIFLVY